MGLLLQLRFFLILENWGLLSPAVLCRVISAVMQASTSRGIPRTQEGNSGAGGRAVRFGRFAEWGFQFFLFSFMGSRRRVFQDCVSTNKNIKYA